MNTNKKQPVYYLNGSPVYASEFEKNNFPYEEVFPKVIVDLVRELHEKAQFPIEFSSGSLLVAFATAIGSTIQLKLRNDFIVMPNLYCMICGDPGTCKTHPLKYMFEPIEKRKAKYYMEYTKKLEEYNAYERLGKKEKEGRKRVTKPTLRVNTIDDFTLEALSKNLLENPRGVSIVVDELNGFIKNMNRYDSGSDGERYNTLWSGGSISKSRASTESFYVPPTAVSIFGTIQPEVLYNFFTKDRDKNGWTARFLFIMPNNLLPIIWRFEDINKDLIQQYNQVIENLLDVELQFNENGDPVPTFIKFTEEASNRMKQWHNGDEYRGKIIEHKGQTYYDALVKFDTYALHFSLILQIMYSSFENESPNEVSIRAVENAILLVNYFMKEVIKVHKFVYGKDIRLAMSETQQKVYDMLPPEFYIAQKYDEVAKLGFTKDQLKKFVGIKKYFTRIKRGCYRKNFIELSDE